MAEKKKKEMDFEAAIKRIDEISQKLEDSYMIENKLQKA